ncbi:hypothetical protein [Ruegeria atlantica]|uniref:Integral membrane protein n=1 Tax=Ruegeria atlantica TaxID=81569 RepID=A0ABX1W751_9RHOB|nr:hypothetical protein [Ruegeria atlantica]NOD29439.1 hypothetical protein [Ruegeria atlantica]
MDERKKSFEPSDDVLMHMMSVHHEYARFHEGLREASTRIILIITGGLFAFALSNNGNEHTLVVSVGIIGLGLFGAALSTAHGAKQVEHYAQSTVFYQALLSKDAELLSLKHKAKEARNKSRTEHGVHLVGQRLRIGRLWTSINLLFALGGVWLFVVSL